MGVVTNVYSEKATKRQTLRITGAESPRIEILVLEVVEDGVVDGYVFTMTNITKDFGIWGTDDGGLFKAKEDALEMAKSRIKEYCSQPTHHVH